MNFNTDNFMDLRTEIAILQEDIDSQNPSIHKFKIPSLITGTRIGDVYTNTNNIANKNILKTTLVHTKFDDIINLRVPKEYTAFFGAPIVPKGTRFIIACVGGNINDIKIIGRYDSIEDMEVR